METPEGTRMRVTLRQIDRAGEDSPGSTPPSRTDPATSWYAW